MRLLENAVTLQIYFSNYMYETCAVALKMFYVALKTTMKEKEVLD